MFEAIGVLGNLAKIVLAIMDQLGIKADGLRTYLRQVAEAQAPRPNTQAIESAQEEELRRTREEPKP